MFARGRGPVNARGLFSPAERRTPQRRVLSRKRDTTGGGCVPTIMSPLESAVLGLYFLTLVILAVFGLHRYVMVFLYYRHRDRRALPQAPPARLPKVTVQLPLYNEMYVVDRLLDSVCRIDYPKELLEIQVLDDSTDETVAIAEAACERHRSAGFDVKYLHRDNRHGFKAGALDEGLRAASGE